MIPEPARAYHVRCLTRHEPLSIPERLADGAAIDTEKGKGAIDMYAALLRESATNAQLLAQAPPYLVLKPRGPNVAPRLSGLRPRHQSLANSSSTPGTIDPRASPTAVRALRSGTPVHSSMKNFFTSMDRTHADAGNVSWVHRGC